MAETLTDDRVNAEIDALHRLAAVVLHEHANHHGLCAVCGCAFPCVRAVLAEPNLAL
ncbi:hypothetical protein ACPCVL_07470 [Streptomyces koyangensis]|uniref:hypothetical protein n=1 Tax=Streptomyces koyangensis TaxID=188770 RepID=UPI003C308FDF